MYQPCLDPVKKLIYFITVSETISKGHLERILHVSDLFFFFVCALLSFCAYCPIKTHRMRYVMFANSNDCYKRNSCESSEYDYSPGAFLFTLIAFL